MATHDYVIANGTGAAVRSDLNDALAAIVSNNSGSSAPATTYAYQWWADTTANVLKIRNSANNAWITLRELDGTMLIEDGTAAAPGLSFGSDTNTGIFRPSNNALAVSANGSVRMTMSNSSVVVNQDGQDVDFRVESNGATHMLFVDAGNNRVGIGDSTPDSPLHVNGGTVNTVARFESTDSITRIVLKDNAGESRIGTDGDAISFHTSSSETERARIDSSGRLLVGTTSSRLGGLLQAESAGSGTSRQHSLTHNQNTSEASVLRFIKSRGTAVGATTSVVDDDSLGFLVFAGTDGTGSVDGAYISGFVNGTPGTDDMPTDLVFWTNSGAASPTERLRITSAGDVGIGTTSPVSFTPTLQISGTDPALLLQDTATAVDYTGINLSSGVVAHWYDDAAAYTIGTASGLSGAGFSEKLRLDSSGRLLVGKTSTGANNGRLQAVSSSGPHIVAQNSGGGSAYMLFINSTTGDAASGDGLYVGLDGNRGYFWNYENEDLTFGTNNSERMRIKNTGKVFVNSTGLSEEGIFNTYSNGSTPAFQATGGSSMSTSSAVAVFDKHANVNTTSQVFINFRINDQNTGSGRINANGASQAAFGSFSDRRLKENIVDLPSQLDNVCKLRPVEFDYIESEGGGHQASFIAQEFEEVFPEAVGEREDGMKTLTGWGKTEAILVKALQEAVAKIEILEAKVAALEAS